MKQGFKTLLIRDGLLLSILLTTGCGGTIGNIKQYDFPITPIDTLVNKVNMLFLTYPSIKIEDKKYQNVIEKGKSIFYFKVNDGKTQYVLCFSVIQYLDGSVLSLTTGAEYGEILFFAKDIGYFKKRKYKKLFEANIVEPLRRMLDGH